MNYPTMEDVLCADQDELQRWQTSLPKPQRDVERTVRRRIAKRLAAEPPAAAEPRPSPAPAQQNFAAAFQKIFGTDART